MTDNYPMFEWAPGVLITDDVSEKDTPIIEETEINNNEPEGEVNVEEANEKNDNDKAEDIFKIPTPNMKLRLMTKNKEYTLLNTRMNLMTKKTLILSMKKMTF